MTALLDILRWVGTAAWLAVFMRLLPSAMRAFRPTRRNLDPVWALICGFAANRLWFVVGSIHNNTQPGVVEAGWLIVGNMFAIALAGGFFRLRGWYAD